MIRHIFLTGHISVEHLMEKKFQQALTQEGGQSFKSAQAAFEIAQLRKFARVSEVAM